MTGGTPPYTYFLTNLPELNDTDNRFFVIDGLHIKINVPDLTQSVYYLNFGVMDSNGKTFLKREEFTIYLDPISKEQEIREIDGIQFAMRYISPGVFTTRPLINFGPRESPTAITVSTGYWMSETEVTQELFQSVMGFNPSMYSSDPASGELQSKRPVENITFIEAKVFCNRLSIKTGKEPVYSLNGVDDWLSFPNELINGIDKNLFIELSTADGYRIPSVYEWQWAAIGADIGGFNTDGYKKAYSGGPINGTNEGLDDYVWYYSNSDLKTHEVGRKLANEVGIYDMSGNVWEYISDGYSMGWAFVEESYGFYSENLIYQDMLDTDPHNPHAPTGIRLVSNK